MPKNVFQKLQTARVELQKMKLKKSGKNDYSKFSYYELADILPHINELCVKHGLFTEFSISPSREDRAETAQLILRNSEKPDETVIFLTDTAMPEVGKKKDGTGGADPIQNLGAKITYMRRYLLMIAFEIVESDQVDVASRNVIDEIEQADLQAIEGVKDITELTKLFSSLKKKYPVKLILPEYDKRKAEIEDQVIKLKE